MPSNGFLFCVGVASQIISHVHRTYFWHSDRPELNPYLYTHHASKPATPTASTASTPLSSPSISPTITSAAPPDVFSFFFCALFAFLIAIFSTAWIVSSHYGGIHQNLSARIENIASFYIASFAYHKAKLSRVKADCAQMLNSLANDWNESLALSKIYWEHRLAMAEEKYRSDLATVVNTLFSTIWSEAKLICEDFAEDLVKYFLHIVAAKDAEIAEKDLRIARLEKAKEQPSTDLADLQAQRDNLQAIADKKTKECEKLKLQCKEKDQARKAKNEIIRQLEAELKDKNELIKALEEESGDEEAEEAGAGAGPVKEKKKRRRVNRAEKKANREKLAGAGGAPGA